MKLCRVLPLLALAVAAAGCASDSAAPEEYLAFEASNLRVAPQVGHEGDALVFSWDLVVSPRHRVSIVFGIDGSVDGNQELGMIECRTVEACSPHARHEVRATSLIDDYGFGAHTATIYVHDDAERVAGRMSVQFRLE